MPTKLTKRVEPEIDFMPNFKKEEDCFNNEVLSNGRPYPRSKPITQRRYENWLSDVINPTSGKYYLSDADSQGKREGPKHTVISIVRVKTRSGKEYLYTHGNLTGYNSFGDLTRTPCEKPEVWTSTKFGRHTGVDKQGRAQRISDGPNGSETIYEIPFSKENLLELAEKRDNDYIQLIVMQESGKKYSVLTQSTFEETIDLFLKPFDYLYKAEYLSFEEKENNRKNAEKQGLVEAQINQTKQKQQK